MRVPSPMVKKFRIAIAHAFFMWSSCEWVAAGPRALRIAIGFRLLRRRCRRSLRLHLGIAQGRERGAGGAERGVVGAAGGADRQVEADHQAAGEGDRLAVEAVGEPRARGEAAA